MFAEITRRKIVEFGPDRKAAIAMAFTGNCTLLISALPMLTSVVAANGVISINPFPLFEGGLMGFRIPPQRLELTLGNLVVIALHPSLKIQLIFDSADQKLEFLGKLNLAEESSGDESASAPSSNSTSATIDSGVENVQ
ncbi:hypothetical protein GEV33_000750 [Tenebrio molitor]|uniref:Uncharacterized protein n=1 Tax=Tenebrio molitor TaxID=7067 RepID=A0A8J6HYJ8_TENMO|nr:hypothetical protein GEV33_000750 [Tenebrio molitor]